MSRRVRRITKLLLLYLSDTKKIRVIIAYRIGTIPPTISPSRRYIVPQIVPTMLINIAVTTLIYFLRQTSSLSSGFTPILEINDRTFCQIYSLFSSGVLNYNTIILFCLESKSGAIKSSAFMNCWVYWLVSILLRAFSAQKKTHRR